MRVFKIRSQKQMSLVSGSQEDSEIELRKRELAATVQKALKVGASLEAREAGRKAFSDLIKFMGDQNYLEKALNSVADRRAVANKTPFLKLRTTLRRLRKDEPDA